VSFIATGFQQRNITLGIIHVTEYSHRRALQMKHYISGTGSVLVLAFKIRLAPTQLGTIGKPMGLIVIIIIELLILHCYFRPISCHEHHLTHFLYISSIYALANTTRRYLKLCYTIQFLLPAKLPIGLHARNFTIQGKPITCLHIHITSARLCTALHYTESCNLF